MSSVFIPDETILLCWRSLIEKFPLYLPTHRFYASKYQEKILVGYEAGIGRHPMEKTCAFLQIEKRICYILTLSIQPNLRRPARGNGSKYGTKLCEIIESFASIQNCCHLQTTPSGQGIAFFKNRNYISLPKSLESYKQLSKNCHHT